MIRIVKHLPEFIYWPIKIFYDDKIKTFYFKSYSQEGEDLILTRILCEKKKGFILMLALITLKDFQTPFYSIKEVGGE